MALYQKLPKDTSAGMLTAIWLVGLCLAYSLVVNGLIALYGFTGLLMPYFFPNNNLALTSSQVWFFTVLALVAGITTTMLGFLAFWFNRLSKNTRAMSKAVFIPLAIVTILLIGGRSYPYHLPASWIWASVISVVMAGIVPVLFLQQPSARKLHSR
jgi:predicted tellurium resistance membrane protein TerC